MPFDGVVMETKPTATTRISLSLLVRMPDGGVLSPPAMAGARLIDALGAFGIPIRAEFEEGSGGTAISAHIKRPWADRLPAPVPEERAELAGQGAHGGANRVLNRIVLTPDLDGLELELPWDALVPQTYWVAG